MTLAPPATVYTGRPHTFAEGRAGVGEKRALLAPAETAEASSIQWATVVGYEPGGCSRGRTAP
jgi:hypothetical protein